MNAYHQSIKVLNCYLGEAKPKFFSGSTSKTALKADETEKINRFNFSQSDVKANYRIGGTEEGARM